MIAQIYKEHTGVSLCVMDDLRGKISEEELAKEPNKYLQRAYQDLEKLDGLMKHAQERGVDPKVLADTAPNISFDHKCLRSIYSKP